jgi:hypothetical protein
MAPHQLASCKDRQGESRLVVSIARRSKAVHGLFLNQRVLSPSIDVQCEALGKARLRCEMRDARCGVKALGPTASPPKLPRRLPEPAPNIHCEPNRPPSSRATKTGLSTTQCTQTSSPIALHRAILYHQQTCSSSCQSAFFFGAPTRREPSRRTPSSLRASERAPSAETYPRRDL